MQSQSTYVGSFFFLDWFGRSPQWRSSPEILGGADSPSPNAVARRGDTVLLLASPGHRLVKLIFACQRAGLVAVPMSPPDPSKLGASAAHRHLLRAVAQTRPAAAVADVGRRRRCPLVLPPPPP